MKAWARSHFPPLRSSGIFWKVKAQLWEISAVDRCYNHEQVLNIGLGRTVEVSPDLLLTFFICKSESEIMSKLPISALEEQWDLLESESVINRLTDYYRCYNHEQALNLCLGGAVGSLGKAPLRLCSVLGCSTQGGWKVLDWHGFLPTLL